MAPNATIDLQAPLLSDTILEVRLGKMTPMRGLTIKSGINKKICDGAIWVGKLGLDGDEHDLTFHGGIEKAVHGYCSSHYPKWRTEYPEAATRFVPGGFGENFVTANMDERNICIGDIYAVGSAAEPLLLQVSLPRNPCFKLNHRFQLKNFAPRTYQLSRTGWYYRVLREGYVQAGDQIRLVKRMNPEWTIDRIIEYLHRNKNDRAMNEALSNIEELREESRKAFKKRLAENKDSVKKAETKWVDYRVVEKETQTPRITSFVFEAVDANTDDTSQMGSHVKIRLPNGLVRAYSITRGSRGRFELGVALDENSRGGSRYLHEEVDEGHIIQVGNITPGITPNAMASNHLFIVGGIGITAFLWLAESMYAINWAFQIHYAVRSKDEVPFADRLQKFGQSLILYDRSKGERLNVEEIIKGMPWNSQLYVCGPGRLMDNALEVVHALSLPEKEVHFEAFAADVGGDPFEAVVKNKDNAVVKVTEEETLLQVLNREFGDVVGSSCEVGNCGTCKIKVTCGQVEHRGTALTKEEKGSEMLACVSRGVGRIIIEYDE